MSPPFVIVDGYNLLHAAGLARLQYGPGDLERARHRLLVLLGEKLRADERRRCTVIFDAQNAPGDLPRQVDYHGLAAQFAPSGQDADTVIEQMIARHPAARRTIVVSSDHRLHQAAKRRNARPVDSETFLEELERRESISPLIEREPAAETRPREHKGSASKPASPDWKQIFGEIDIAMIAEQVRQEPIAGPSSIGQDASQFEHLQRQLDDPDWLERWLKESPPGYGAP